MIDVFNIPNNNASTQIYYGTVYDTTVTFLNGTITGSWQTWQKPRGCRFIHIFCLGSGGGGGVGGYTAGGVFSFGRGGGSGAITKAIFPADVLPDTLYVLPGVAGPAAIGGGTGNGGLASSGSWPRHSIVAIRPITAWPDAMNVVCASGGTSNGGVITNGLTYEDAVTTTYAGLLTLANWTSNEGQYPGAGSVGWGDNTFNNATIVTAGRSSDNMSTSGNGGSITSVDLGIMQTPLIAGGLGSSTGDATDGQDGQWFWKPVMFGVGGGGGGNSSVGLGGRGGDGGYGCGGGAGGWGATGQGRGGRGGDGLIIITAF